MEITSGTGPNARASDIDRIDALLADRVFMDMALGRMSNNGVSFSTDTKNARFDEGMQDIVAFLNEIGEE